MCFQRYKMEIHDPPGVRSRLKVRLLKAEVVETLLYRCMTWSLKKPIYDRLRRVHRSMLLQCLGWQKRKRDDHTLSYADALDQTDPESVEAIVRKQRIKKKKKCMSAVSSTNFRSILIFASCVVGTCNMLLLFSHMNYCQKSKVRGHTKVLEP